jgi:hypothetical protein
MQAKARVVVSACRGVNPVHLCGCRVSSGGRRAGGLAAASIFRPLRARICSTALSCSCWLRIYVAECQLRIAEPLSPTRSLAVHPCPSVSVYASVYIYEYKYAGSGFLVRRTAWRWRECCCCLAVTLRRCRAAGALRGRLRWTASLAGPGQARPLSKPNGWDSEDIGADTCTDIHRSCSRRQHIHHGGGATCNVPPGHHQTLEKTRRTQRKIPPQA